MADHNEQGKLSQVKQSSDRERAGKEEDYTVRCPVMELHKPHERVFMTLVDYVLLLLGEDKSS